LQDVSYSVTNRKKKLGSITILTSVSGYFKPGEMAALMGPSGSGKSTLLDILAGRKTVGTISGEIKIGGEKPSRMFLRRYTGYVEQSDTLLDILTVEEMLMYTAELKRSESEPESSKKGAVEEILGVLALDSCRDVLIGSPLARGISGGQAKRVNIGIALITSPRILFLDEPTSGLDSFTANEVMTVVKGLSSSGITVCATIHSPTPYCFALFDRLLLLLRGEMAYFGKSGAPALEYFQSIVPQASKRKEEENEAEWIVNLTTQADRQNKAGEFASVFSKSQQKVECDLELNNQLSSISELDEDARRELAVKRETATSSWHGLKTLLKYRTTKNYRNPAFLGPRLGDKFIFSLLFLTVYWGIGADLVAENVVNVAGMLLMWVILPAFGAASYIPAIVLERPLFVRERNDGLYRVITYLCAKTIEELGIAFAASLIFSNVVFWAVNFHGGYVIFWLLYLCTLATGIMVAYFVAAVSPNIDVANAALPAYITTLIFFSGLLIRWSQIPDW
jgi:ABC-type multidrug transport system ATPase subunit